MMTKDLYKRRYTAGIEQFMKKVRVSRDSAMQLLKVFDGLGCRV